MKAVIAVRIEYNTAIGQYLMGMVWDWMDADPELYRNQTGFDDKEDWIKNGFNPSVNEFIIFVDGIPQAWFALEIAPLDEAPSAEKLHFIPAPDADLRIIVRYLRDLVRYAISKGAVLYARWPQHEKYRPARKLAKLIGVQEK